MLALLLTLALVSDRSEGFELLEPGEIQGGAGLWFAAPGNAEIHTANRRSGDQSLRLLGGNKRTITLNLPPDQRDVYELRFWAERWTARAPFRFLIEGLVDGTWRRLYDATPEIRVGGFDAHVRVPIPEELVVESFRFECTSPVGSGVIIDDVEFPARAPMEIESVDVVRPVAPVLVGNENNPLIAVRVDVRGNQKPLVLSELTFSAPFEGLRSLAVWSSESRDELDVGNDSRLGKTFKPSDELRVRVRRELQPGLNTFWLTGWLKPGVDIDERLPVRAKELKLADGRTFEPSDVERPEPLRLGVALRKAGDNNVRAYRIPGLVTTNKGTLLAVYDQRHRGWNDLPGDIDVGLSRSTDGGRTWSRMKTILDMGEPHEENGVGDPSILVDRRTGTVWVAALWSRGDRAWNGSGPGLRPDETGQLVMVSSKDDGKTWSKPRNLTRDLKDPKWRLLLQGPGKGITMRDGTLVFPAQYRGPDGVPHSTILTSRTHGRSWRIGNGAKPDTTEAQVVELPDGSLLLNMRDNRGGARSVFVTDDLGKTWREHSSSRKALREPVCMASLIRFEGDESTRDDDLFLFSNPNVERAPRRRMTVKVSRDCASWPEDWQTLIDEGSSAGYSCLTVIDRETIGILYECSRSALAFQRLPLRELLGE